MLVAAAVAEHQAVTLALLHHERIDVRPGLVVDGPCVELRALLRTNVAEGQDEGFVRRGRGGGVGELRVVPRRPGRDLSRPARPFCPAYSTTMPRPISRAFSSVEPSTQTPGVVHLDDGVHALRDGERKHFHALRIRHGIAVHGNDCELVARQREHHVLGGAGIQQAHQHALALLDADGLARAQHVRVDGGVFVAHVGAGGQRHVGRLLAHGFHHGNEGGLPVVNGEIDLPDRSDGADSLPSISRNPNCPV